MNVCCWSALVSAPELGVDEGVVQEIIGKEIKWIATGYL